MPKLRTLSGTEVIAILGDFGFRPVSQRGSHVKVCRTLEDGQTQTLTVPNHKEIDRGTLQAIFRQAGRFIPESECAAYSSPIERCRAPERPIDTHLCHFSTLYP
jgi:predicted RNA binding protein YcfA (HicA-like mRNA interferase family)